MNQWAWVTQVCNGTQPGEAGRPRREAAVSDLTIATNLPCDLIQTIVLPDLGYPICNIRELGYSTLLLLKLAFWGSGSPSQASVGHLSLTLNF